MQAPPPPPHKSNNVLWIVLAVVGVCGCGGVAILAAILFPVFSQAKLAAKKSLALSNVKQSSLALLIYSVDNNDRLPIADKWMDLTEGYTRQSGVFSSPEATPENPNDYGFAFRTELGKKKTVDFADAASQVMAFDSTLLSRNANSGLETVPVPGRYGGSVSRGNMFGYMDGHVKFVLDRPRDIVQSDDEPATR